LGEEKKKGLFINVTVGRAEGPVKSYPFFTDVSSGGILEGSSGYSGFHVSPEEFKYIKEMLDKKRRENVEGTLVEATLMKRNGVKSLFLTLLIEIGKGFGVTSCNHTFHKTRQVSSIKKLGRY
jgi:hypothetical protein